MYRMNEGRCHLHSKGKMLEEVLICLDTQLQVLLYIKFLLYIASVSMNSLKFTYRIASYLHGVPIFAFFARQNNLVKIISYKKTQIDRTTCLKCLS